METFIATLLLLGLLWLVAGGDKATPAPVVVADPGPGDALKYVDTVTVSVDDPRMLTDAIARVRREKAAGGFFTDGYVVGAPQITNDGKTAYLSLFQ